MIVPAEAELLADTEPITFTYLYRQVSVENTHFQDLASPLQSINDFVRERAGSEITIDIAVQLTALLVLDESLCTGARTSVLVKYDPSVHADDRLT